jgi:hypothetical protein
LKCRANAKPRQRGFAVRFRHKEITAIQKKIDLPLDGFSVVTGQRKTEALSALLIDHLTRAQCVWRKSIRQNFCAAVRLMAPIYEGSEKLMLCCFCLRTLQKEKNNI